MSAPSILHDAKTAGVEGVVTLQVAIATDGSVIDTSVLRSIPMLDDAARHAVMRWRFEPALLNGEHPPYEAGCELG